MGGCNICGNAAGNTGFTVREMMFGSRGEFRYAGCSGCGCMWLENIPDSVPGSYPEDYYSFKGPDSSKDNLLESFINRQKTLYRLGLVSPVGRLLSMKRRKEMPQYIDWFRRASVRLDSSILDVGCGSGSLLVSISKDGFTDLLGIDPYIKDDISYGRGLKILKKSLSDLDGQFDFIMLNHSLEHMPDHSIVFGELRRLLKDAGRVLIRAPVASSFASREYQASWVQLDAPRHLFLHSVESLKNLADKSGFGIADTVFDSTGFQFWGSIQYVKDIPLNDPRSYAVSPGNSIFSQKDIEKFGLRAEELNRKGDGDQACFYLYKK